MFSGKTNEKTQSDIDKQIQELKLRLQILELEKQNWQ